MFIPIMSVLPPSGLHAESKRTETVIKGSDGAEMVIIPGGEFLMGSEDEDLIANAMPHKVYVSSFYMDKYEATNRLFAEFLNSVQPPEGKNELRWNWVVLRSDLGNEERSMWWPTEILYDKEKQKYYAFAGYEDFPVLSVSWHAADEYCKWAAKRLPTEAEWERAARGGLQGKAYPWGNEIPTGGIIFEKRWLSNAIPPPTESVGNYHPNGYGLYDMAGNVWEWCADWYDTDYYKKSPKKNPRGPDTGQTKALRGGSWFNSAIVMRVAFRNNNPPTNLDDAVGFRCAMDLKNTGFGF
ncbi:MAG: formylglycine-generating enzyme family protein [Thermodesulfovibrionales bacterium]|nr:formylglycine-generating enzyme family protein [Thermodesulfovibrionales bacterium]